MNDDGGDDMMHGCLERMSVVLRLSMCDAAVGVGFTHCS